MLWAAKWMRRWLQESRDVHADILETSAEVHARVSLAKCYHPATEESIALVELHETDLNCTRQLEPVPAAKVGDKQGVNVALTSSSKCYTTELATRLLLVFIAYYFSSKFCVRV